MLLCRRRGCVFRKHLKKMFAGSWHWMRWAKPYDLFNHFARGRICQSEKSSRPELKSKNQWLAALTGVGNAVNEGPIVRSWKLTRSKCRNTWDGWISIRNKNVYEYFNNIFPFKAQIIGICTEVWWSAAVESCIAKAAKWIILLAFPSFPPFEGAIKRRRPTGK